MGTAAPGAGGDAEAGDAEAGDAAAEEAAGETADCAGAGAGAFNARSSAHAALGSK
jgi:hypothetical protein